MGVRRHEQDSLHRDGDPELVELERHGALECERRRREIARNEREHLGALREDEC